MQTFHALCSIESWKSMFEKLGFTLLLLRNSNTCGVHISMMYLTIWLIDVITRAEPAPYIMSNTGDSSKLFLLCGNLQENELLQLTGSAHVALFKACIMLSHFETSSKIHRDVSSKALWGSCLCWQRLVDSHVLCGLLSTAQEVLNSLYAQNIVPWPK